MAVAFRQIFIHANEAFVIIMCEMLKAIDKHILKYGAQRMGDLIVDRQLNSFLSMWIVPLNRCYSNAKFSYQSWGTSIWVQEIERGKKMPVSLSYMHRFVVCVCARLHQQEKQQ